MTAVEHVKPLRGRLESAFVANVKQQDETLDRSLDRLELKCQEVAESLVAAQKNTKANLFTQHKRSTEGLLERLHKLDDSIDGKFVNLDEELHGRSAELNLFLALGGGKD